MLCPYILLSLLCTPAYNDSNPLPHMSFWPLLFSSHRFCIALHHFVWIPSHLYITRLIFRNTRLTIFTLYSSLNHLFRCIHCHRSNLWTRLPMSTKSRSASPASGSSVSDDTMPIGLKDISTLRQLYKTAVLLAAATPKYPSKASYLDRVSLL